MLPHFTVQQLQGGSRYNHKTKIGNWLEDRDLEDIKYITHKT